MNHAEPVSIDSGNRERDRQLHSLGWLSMGGGGRRRDSATRLRPVDASRVQVAKAIPVSAVLCHGSTGPRPGPISGRNGNSKEGPSLLVDSWSRKRTHGGAGMDESW